MQNDKDKLVKKMAKLLQEGATMLNYTCPKCNTLIYRLPNKKIICPSCNSEIIIQKEDSSVQKFTNTPTDSKIYNFEELSRIILSKIDVLNKKLQDEIDYGQMDKILTILEKLLSLHEKISTLHQYSGGN
ncbi:MAG: hypothetical protein EU530_06510 [Promethearchaeota archaeon]|nr:MAG: hypothetical protein EU530_06510 [Candidatus Lokiarchaeota archaeon]